MRRILVCSVVVMLLTFLLALAPGAGAALPPEAPWQWAAPYTTTTVPGFHLMAAGPDGSVYVAGADWASQWCVSRVGSDGTQVWSVTTLGPEDAGAGPCAFATDANRNLIVAGRSLTRDGDFWVVKYRSGTGSVAWQKRWNGSASKADTPYAVAVDKSGNVYVAGMTSRADYSSDAVVVKYDAAGRYKWKYVLATSKYDAFYAGGLDGAGNFYVTGQLNWEMGEAEIVTIKLSPSGRRLWQRTAGGLGGEYRSRFLRVRGTSVTVVGELNVESCKPVILRYTLVGQRTWAAANTPRIDRLKDAVVDAKGRVILIGDMTTAFGTGPLMTVGTLHVYEPGEKWPSTSAMVYGDFDVNTKWPVELGRVMVASDGRIYCAGTLYTSGTHAEGNALVVSFPPTDAAGWHGADMIWRYDGPASGVDEFRGLLRVSDSAIYACGYRVGGGGPEAVLDRLDLSAGL